MYVVLMITRLWIYTLLEYLYVQCLTYLIPIYAKFLQKYSPEVIIASSVTDPVYYRTLYWIIVDWRWRHCLCLQFRQKFASQDSLVWNTFGELIHRAWENYVVTNCNMIKHKRLSCNLDVGFYDRLSGFNIIQGKSQCQRRHMST